jgi:hypothetical protein
MDPDGERQPAPPARTARRPTRESGPEATRPDERGHGRREIRTLKILTVSTDINTPAQRVKDDAVVRSNSRGGRSAAEHLVSAMRCLYKHAEADRLISAANNTAIRVAKRRFRGPPRRHAVSMCNRMISSSSAGPAGAGRIGLILKIQGASTDGEGDTSTLRGSSRRKEP